jgi:adenosylhomocysteine nucleosidase
MRVGIIGPSDEEISVLIGRGQTLEVTERASLKFYSGQLKNTEVVLVICGVGKVNACIATQVLIDQFAVTHIVLTGAAGGLDDRLNCGDIIVSAQVAHHDLPAEILTEYHPWMKSIYIEADRAMVDACILAAGSSYFSGKVYEGIMVSGETFISSTSKHKELTALGAMCVDMESASVAQTCYVNRVPFVVIRSISDHADEDSVEAFESNVEAVSLNSLALVEGLLVGLQSSLH